jgi:hypothetical protein
MMIVNIATMHIFQSSLRLVIVLDSDATLQKHRVTSAAYGQRKISQC